MGKGASWHFTAVLCGLALILLGCRPGEGTPTATVTASPTLTAEIQPEAAPAQASPTPMVTPSPEIAPLALPPYPEPNEDPMVTKVPPADPDVTPTEAVAIPPAEFTATSTEDGTTLPPPYPGAGTPEPTNPNPPPYPATTGTDQPAATLAASSPTPTAAGRTPTATDRGEVTPTSTPQDPVTPPSTPTITLTPTISPTPRPRIEPREVDIPCILDGTTLLCEDELIEYSFALPADWVMGVTGMLRPGETGVQYGYDLQRALNARPETFQIGGISWDFSDGREGLLTDFAGFTSDATADRCAQFQGAEICEPITEEILLVFLFPEAERLCSDGPQLLGRPLVLIAIDLPDNELIDGLVFVGDFLSSALLADYVVDRADLLESGSLAGTPCDPFRQSRFNVRMLELVAAVRNEILDEITLAYIAEWRGLGDSLTPLAE